MAWPCITRACCINRFWSELDKADIAVPLVFTKYSDVAEVQHVHPQRQPRDRSAALETHASEQDSATKATQQHASAALGDPGSSSSVMRQDFKAWKVRPERSCKPRNQYHPSETPFNNETQYRKDYKPWPIPKKGDHPWIPKASPTKTAPEGTTVPSAKEQAIVTEVETGVEKCEIEEKQQEKETKEREKPGPKKEKEAEESQGDKQPSQQQQGQEDVVEGKGPEGKGRAAADALNRQIKKDTTTGSSYRREYKAYKDVKPVRPIRAKSQYKLPTSEKASLETSYSATFKGEQGAPPDNKQMERRRIRSLYSEPRKDPAKQVERNSSTAAQPKAKKSTTPASLSRPGRKPRDKQKEKQTSGSGQTAKKKSSITSLKSDPAAVITSAPVVTSAPTASSPSTCVSKQSKEMINRLAESKE